MERRQGALEVLGLNIFGDTYRDRRVLVTGHTGFKGSWLCLWLQEMGANVTGLALEPWSVPNHWNLLDLDIHDHRVDIRDEAAVRSVLEREQPEIVFHLAAQPLVRRSYRETVPTWCTNVMGAVHVLEAVRHTPSVRAAVVVTSDKCYDNQEWPWPYREVDRLGGHDPYSASKAGAELVAASYRSAFFGRRKDSPLVATARAGNVIGGGDWSEDRLIPDLVRALSSDQPLIIRSPFSTRPWQHVLDCLSGYLLLGQRLLAGDSACADSWNFGPDQAGNRTVEDVLHDIGRLIPSVRWKLSSQPQPQPHEAGLLQLDCAKARMNLKWRPIWDYEDTIHQTAVWYSQWLENGAIKSRSQLAAYLDDAYNCGVVWTQENGT